MNIQIKKTSIPGCVLVTLPHHTDRRGDFVKIFHADIFRQNGLEAIFQETYYSRSKRHVLRGLHFQVPPYEHVKLVHCLDGVIFDAVVDLRHDSPSFLKVYTVTLSSHEATALYIPKGMAHGFMVKSDSALVLYEVSTVYSAAHDMGVLWNSAGIPWPYTNPIISERDNSFVTLSAFQSPFHYGNV